MYTNLLLVALAALAALAAGTPTHCDRWKGSLEFRCAKNNYGADSIQIRSIVNSNIRFTKWMSECGRRGVNYSHGSRNLGPLQSTSEFFGEALGNACNELFIADCRQDGRTVNCVNILTPSVNLV